VTFIKYYFNKLSTSFHKYSIKQICFEIWLNSMGVFYLLFLSDSSCSFVIFLEKLVSNLLDIDAVLPDSLRLNIINKRIISKFEKISFIIKIK